MSTFLLPAPRSSRTLLTLMNVLCILALTLVPFAGLPTPTAQAAGTPTVTYNATNNTIFIGEEYSNPDDRDHPSRPDLLADKEAITIPDLDAELTSDGHPDLLVDQGSGVWLLNAHIIINQTARLDVTSAAVSELRLNSPPDAAPDLLSVPPSRNETTPAFVVIVAFGGHLNIDGGGQGNCPEPAIVRVPEDVGDCSTNTITVRSWDAAQNGPDQVMSDGRSYLLAYEGGRMDIINADMSYLGWKSGEGSGMAWRQRGEDNEPETGATGSMRESSIHNNLYALYSYKAHEVIAKHNDVYDNIGYGLDPHDYSQYFVFAYNDVYGNGNHGIIFSRGCVYNKIHHNVVHDNLHGIMLDRGSDHNEVYNNVVVRNEDGIAVFQSSNNLISNNEVTDNTRDGVRIEAPYRPGDVYDGVAVNNTFEDNVVDNSGRYGFYVRIRADNNIIRGNTISDNTSDGIYIATGGNLIEDNYISESSAAGIRILTDDPITETLTLNPPRLGSPEIPAYRNTIIGNTVVQNTGGGILLRGAVETQIGSSDVDDRNTISENPGGGISIRNGSRDNYTVDKKDDIMIGSTDNLIVGNLIQGNGLDGVSLRDALTLRNKVSQNSFVSNTRSAIRTDGSANQGITPPTLQVSNNVASGQTVANGVVEVYSGANSQGEIYLGNATANGSGDWSFPLPDDYRGAIMATVTDPVSNTSVFTSTAPVVVAATISIGPDRDLGNAETIFVSGRGAEVTLPIIKAELQRLGRPELLDSPDDLNADGQWQLNAGLTISTNVTLLLDPSTVTWLKLRSQADDISLAGESCPGCNYDSFVALKTRNGTIVISGTRITSWDPNLDDFDTDISNGRSFILAKGNARMDIINATISHLGSDDGESYGLSWRDPGFNPDGSLRLRVTGNVINSDISYNYFGIYTYQARDMVFRDNKFHHNISYGFDPHDYSHHFIVERNEAYNNGNHGFIISRGCNNFIFRYNKSYNNNYTVDDQDKNAHGFMLDPGSPNSEYPQVPSYDNLYEYNEAWGNDGYGFRILGSQDNIIRNNIFYNNLQGISLETATKEEDDGSLAVTPSTGNIIETNVITNSGVYGIWLRQTSGNNTIRGNQVSGSGSHGIYIRTAGNIVENNTATGNGTIAGGSGIATLPETTLPQPGDGETSPEAQAALQLAALDPAVIEAPIAVSAVDGNQIINNIASDNATDGIELKGATNTTVMSNTIEQNDAEGIQVARYVSGNQTFPATGNAIVSNTIRTHVKHGIWISTAADLLVQGNTIENNVQYGIQARGLVNSILRNNVITGNQSHGLALEQTSTGNTIADNTISNNKLSGVYLIGGSDDTTITGNQVSGNGVHGIYLKTGGNTIANNTVTNNGTVGTTTPSTGSGIALLPETGATAALADFTLPDEAGPSLAAIDPESLGVPGLTSVLTANEIISNTITSNVVDGIELKGATNTLIQGNTIESNRAEGVQIARYISGQTFNATGNTLRNNIIRNHVTHGIWFNVAASSTVEGNTIANNAGSGIRAQGLTNSIIRSNTIQNNGTPQNTGVHGIILSDASTGNQIMQNIITGNAQQGIRANGATTLRNSWSENSIYANGTAGIAVTSGANGGIRIPRLTSIQDLTVVGTTRNGQTVVPNATVEIFSDDGTQGRYFEGRATANANGDFTFTASLQWRGRFITAVTTDSNNNSSAFAVPIQRNNPPFPAAFDFGTDKVSDLLWRSSTDGSNGIWTVNTTSTIATRVRLVRVPDLRWKVFGTGDCDADGDADIFWHHDGGRNTIWQMNGTALVTTIALSRTVGTQWQAAIGDFDGNGTDDLLWRNKATGDNAIWFINNCRVTSAVPTARLSGAGWTLAGVGDMDGDLKDDLFWHNTATGDNSVWLMNGAVANQAPTAKMTDLNWQVVDVGDFDGNRTTDVLWRNTSITDTTNYGQMVIWPMTGAQVGQTIPLPRVDNPAWVIGGTGDYNGDRTTDIVWRKRPQQGQSAFWLLNGTSSPTRVEIPLVGIRWRLVGTGSYNSTEAGLASIGDGANGPLDAAAPLSTAPDLTESVLPEPEGLSSVPETDVPDEPMETDDLGDAPGVEVTEQGRVFLPMVQR